MDELCVAVSGKGSLLEAMFENGLPIDLVLADRECRGLELAKAAKVPTELLLRTDFSKKFDRRAYTMRTIDALRSRSIGLVAMAGYNTIWSPEIFEVYGNRIINTHPSLLPAFKGHYAVRDTLAYGAKVTGCTIHFATPELDEGPILAQEAVPVREGDTVDTLWERIKEVERVLYPRVIRDELLKMRFNRH